MKNIRAQIDGAKARLPLPALLATLGLAEHAHKSARCPFHEDRSPSFSVFCGTHGWRWKCQAGCGEGDEIDFLEIHRRCARNAAVRLFLEMAGGSFAPTPPPPHKANVETSGIALPPDATPGTQDDWQALAELRNVNPLAPATAAKYLGTLLFGTVCRFPSWILTDERRLCAEARRMDGKPFPEIGTLGARKAHTIKGSVKSWPVGLAVNGYKLADFRALLAVEGGPDYLAALHFALQSKADCIPIAFLGAGVAGAIHADAAPFLRGRRVRFFPHADRSGDEAVGKWAQQLEALGAKQDAFGFTGLRRADGSPVKDLNDCSTIHPDDAHELAEVLP